MTCFPGFNNTRKPSRKGRSITSNFTKTNTVLFHRWSARPRECFSPI